MDQASQENFSRSSSASTGVTNCHQETVLIDIIMRDDIGEPWEGIPWTLSFGDETWEGVTTAEGAIEQEVPAAVETGELRCWPTGNREDDPQVFTIVGEKDPLKLATGQTAALHNLDFTAVDADGNDVSSLEEELFFFRLAAGLPDGNEVDDDVQAALGKFYDVRTSETPFDPFDVDEDDEAFEEEEEEE